MKLYKLTDKNNKTRAGYHNECVWGPGVTHKGTGVGELCGPGYIHAYTSPYLAVLLNPIHANMNLCKLWEADGKIVKNDNGLKVGSISLTTIKELPLPIFTTEQKIYFALLCASRVYKDSGFIAFVNNWVSGKDRSARAAAEVAAWAARSAAEVAARAAEVAARAAARSAAEVAARAAARSAAEVAARAAARSAAEVAARAAAEAAAWAAAEAAAWAAEAAAEADFDLIKQAEQAYNWRD